MENTVGNKEKFFAQYYNQFIVGEHSNKATTARNEFDNFDINDAYLKLKPLSAISDEDAIEQVLFAKKIGENISVRIYENDDRLGLIELGKWRSIECLENLPYQEIDFLRSKGYAVNWIDLTVDQQIEYGWIKLTNQ